MKLCRRDGGTWSCATLGPDETLALELAGGVGIDLPTIHDGVRLDA